MKKTTVNPCAKLLSGANPLKFLLSFRLSAKLLVFTSACLYSVTAVALESQLSTRSPGSSLPSSEVVKTEPCLHPRNETVDKTLGRSVKIQARECGKGAEEA